MLRSVGQRLSSSVKQGNMRMEFLIVLSPAKTLDETTVKCPVASTKPLLGKGAEYLADALGKLTRKELDKLLGVKGKIGCLNFERYQNWMDLKQKQAGMMFSGAAYKTLRFPELDSSQMTFAQSHLRILCGLYGVLRPCDKIRPYRLDMSKKLSTAKGKNNYEFWGSQITDALNKDIKKLTVINVASQEYFKSIHVEELNAPVITCMFPGPSVYAKMARGAMTRYLISNEIDSLEKLKEFDGGDYYKGGSSSENTFVFQRLSSPGKSNVKKRPIKSKSTKLKVKRQKKK
eukprot:GSMAST32.ASY1.ANO1.793.1 assembled CDS